MSIPRAQDGHRARDGGPWTREKLTYLGKYSAAFTAAMTPKRAAGKWDRLVFIDLLCGAGIDIINGIDHDGSPLIALKTKPPFDRLFLGDVSRRNVDALRHRIPEGEMSRVDLKAGDCHARAREIVASLGRRDLGFAFVDPEGFEVRFELFATLAQRRIDILLLFPSGIGITRNLREFARSEHCALDALWGNREWRDLPQVRRLASGSLSVTGEDELDQSFVQAFRERVATLGYVHHAAAPPLRSHTNVPMYQLLFFSKDKAGLTIWNGISRIDPRGQRSLAYGED